MWVALFVGMLFTGEIQMAISTEPYKTEAECKAINAQVEQLIKDGKVDGLKKHSLSCVKVDLK